MFISIKKKSIRAFDNIFWNYNKIFNKKFQNIKKLENKFSKRPCFIMGNGPSLKLCDLSKLKDEITICSNAQYLIWDEMGFTPTFLTVEDKLVAEDRAKELNMIKDTIKIFPFDLRYCLEKDEKTIYINFIRNYNDFPKFSDNFARIVYWGGTVSFLNLQLAYYLGCNPIYLIGFDHKYVVPDKSKINNFVIKSEANDVNHIHPNYFGPGYRWHDPNVKRMEKSYVVARDFLKQRGVTVYNATFGGNLEVFERINFNEIFCKIERLQ